MASISIIGMTGWGNPYSRLLDALRPSSSYEGGLRAPFLCGLGVAGMADHTRPRVWTSAFFQRPVQHDFPLQPRFLRRPQLLTRLSSPSLREGLPSCTRWPFEPNLGKELTRKAGLPMSGNN